MSLILNKCRDKALELLSYREYFSNELIFKLKRNYDFTDDEIFKAVEFIKKYDYLNDERALSVFAEEIKRKKRGFLYFKSKIIEKQSSNLLRLYNLNDFYSFDEEYLTAKRFLATLKINDIFTIKKKLKNRGFSFQTIVRIENDFKK